jgi:uncharacterized protein YoxC
LTGDVSLLTGNVVTIETDLENISGNIDTLTGDVSLLTGNVVTIETELGNISGNIDTLTGDVSLLTGNVVTIETELGNISGSIESLEANVDVVFSNIDSLTGDVSLLTSNVSSLDGNLSALETSLLSLITDLQARVSYLESQGGSREFSPQARYISPNSVTMNIEGTPAGYTLPVAVRIELSRGNVDHIVSLSEYTGTTTDITVAGLISSSTYDVKLYIDEMLTPLVQDQVTVESNDGTLETNLGKPDIQYVEAVPVPNN